MQVSVIFCPLKTVEEKCIRGNFNQREMANEDRAVVQIASVIHLSPPKFSNEYEQWKFQLECWLEEPDFPKRGIGVEILMTLPDTGEDTVYKCWEFVQSQMTKAELTAEDGYSHLMAILGNHFAN